MEVAWVCPATHTLYFLSFGRYCLVCRVRNPKSPSDTKVYPAGWKMIVKLFGR